MPNHHMVASSGVQLSTTDSGNPGGETVILVHGFPDNQSVWDLVVPLLEPTFRIVTYDVRGAGGSTAPAHRSGYRMARLIDDLVAVMDRFSPDRPVHLVGHDWGSVQLWGAVMRAGNDERLTGRVASYTSISGPGLDLFAHFIGSNFRRRNFGVLLRQIAHSWYIGAFQLPFAPELVFRHLGGPLQRSLRRSQRLNGNAHWSDSFASDGANGVNLYRANGLDFSENSTTVPVQLIVPANDAFITKAMFADLDRFAPNLTRVDVVAGHWLPRTHPEILAERITAFAQSNRTSGR